MWILSVAITLPTLKSPSSSSPLMTNPLANHKAIRFDRMIWNYLSIWNKNWPIKPNYGPWIALPPQS